MGASSANFPNRPFRLEVHTSLVQQSGNSSLIQTAAWINKNSASPTYDFNPSYYAVYTGGALVGSGSFTYDFRNYDSLLIHASNNWFGHDANGFLSTTTSASADVSTMGHAELAYAESWPRIPKPALAPTPVSIDQITATSMRYTFRGEDLRGGTLARWELQYAKDSAFTDGATIITANNSGVTTLTGLIPGIRYWVRSRAVTVNIGAGAWSGALNASTLPSLRVSVNGAWVTPQVLVSTGTAWVNPELRVSVDGAWVLPIA